MLFLAYALTVALFVAYIPPRPHLIVRPSVWFALCMILRINGAAAMAFIDHEVYLRHNFMFRLLAIVFPLGVVAWCMATPKLTMTANEVYRRCRATNSCLWHLNPMERQMSIGLAILAIGILFWYFRTLPFGRIGLVAVLTNPENATMAREESLALLPNRWLAYAYSLHMSLIGPLLAVMIFLWSPKSHLLRLLRVPLILLVGVSVMLTGARGPGGLVLMGLAIVYLLRRGIRRGAVVIVVSAFAAMLLATVLSVCRKGDAEILSSQTVADTLTGGIFGRVFVTPFKTGLWTNLYAQECGLLGVRNIRPLAALLGYRHERLPNIIALEFMPSVPDSGTANTCFVFDLQASFGLPAGWAVALALLCLLDFGLYIVRGLTSGMLLACMGVLLLAVHIMISSAYTTCLLSHGIIPVLALATLYQWLSPRMGSKQGSAWALQDHRSGTPSPRTEVVRREDPGAPHLRPSRMSPGQLP